MYDGEEVTDETDTHDNDHPREVTEMTEAMPPLNRAILGDFSERVFYVNVPVRKGFPRPERCVRY